MAPLSLPSSLHPRSLLKKNASSHVHELKSVDSLDGTSLAQIVGKDPSFGTNPVIKTFYEGRNSSRSVAGDNFDWVESPPKQLSDRRIRKYDGVALKVYKIKDYDQPTVLGRTPLKIHMIDIQSPHLISALKDILEEVGVYLEVHELARFQAPFRPLYFCYDAIREQHRRATSAGEAVLAQHLRLLLSVMGELFDGFRTTLQHLRDAGLINYKLAWTFFAKNSIVYSACDGTERLLRVTDTVYIKGNEEGLVICGEQLAFDGDAFRWQPINARIPKFAGNQPIDDMPHYPFSCHKNQPAVKERLAERGRQVLEYQDVMMRECEGMATAETPEGEGKLLLSGRVLVDFYGYHKYHKGLERSDVREEEVDKERKKREKERNRHGDLHSLDLLPPNEQNLPPMKENSTADKKKADVYVKRLSEEQQAANRAEVLKKPADLPFISEKLYGYSLKNKMWLTFHVGDLKPCQWNDEAYGHLVYPEEQKDLVLSFVANHKAAAPKKGDASDDVILGKGRGLVILLSGPPGTGKTLTAEATADATRRPLYALHAEDLGTSAAQLGASLKQSFNMAADWNAVVLLDEADVFMAMRHPSDVHRNELVSIFLRELEYFSGTIFLTTNLLQNIDPAFRSRVDIHLLFNPLSASSRELLWRKFLKRLPAAKTNVNTPGETSESSASSKQKAKQKEGLAEDRSETVVAPLSDAAYRTLARWDLNGREIKNAVKTVRTWCACKGTCIDLARLEAGINVTAPRAVKLADGEASRQGREWETHVGTVGGGWGGNSGAGGETGGMYM